MKVLMLASWYKHHENDIDGSFFREQAICVEKKGHTVVLATLELIKSCKENLKKHCTCKISEDEGIKVYHYYMLSLGAGSNRISVGPFNMEYDYYMEYTLWGYKKLIDIIYAEEKKFDIIHAQSTFPAGYAACRLKKKLNTPVVITEHFSDIPAGKLTKKKIKALKYSIEEADDFMCVTDYFRKEISKMLGIDKEKMGVIPNVLSPLFYYDHKIEKYSEFTFVSVGRLINRKGMDVLIQVFGETFKEYSNVRLLIIGDGEEKEKYVRICEEHNYRVSFLGQKSREELANIIRRSHCFVLNSRLETFGVVYIEALACGIPTIGTYNGGSNEIIDGFGGIGIKVDDTQALKKSMLDVYNNIYKFDSYAVSEEVKKSFSEENISNMILNMYQKHVN